MTNLAGYDLVIQIAREAIRREVLNLPLEVGPTGEVLDTLVPPFSFAETLSLVGMGGRFHLIVRSLDVLSVSRTANLAIHLSFSDGSIVLPGASVQMLGGDYRLTLPLIFTQPTSTNWNSEFAVNFAAANGILALDDDSQRRLNEALPPTMGHLALSAMNVAILNYFHNLGLRTVGFRFRIMPFFNSNTMMTLTAVPQIMWIDNDTLGIFGQHRRRATTGNPLSKTQGDLPPPPFTGFPGWAPVVSLLSPESFRRMIACPAVTAVARDHVAGAVRWRFIVSAGGPMFGEPTEEQLATAEQHTQQYLDSTEGRARIQSKTPAPCGSGKIDQRVPMPGPIADATAYIDNLSMTLGQGRIDIIARAHAEVFCGRVDVTLPMWIEPRVNQVTQQMDVGPVFRSQPQTRVNADLICKVIVGTLLSFLVGPFVGSVVTIAGVAIGEGVAESILGSKLMKRNFPTPEAGGVLPPFVRWERVEFDPSALMLIGRWPGEVWDPRAFAPGIRLVTGYDYEPSSSVRRESGEFTADCPQGSGTFRFSRLAWDTTIRVHLEAQDVPQPLTIEGWSMILNGQPFDLRPGEFTVSGNVVVLEPPSRQKLEAREEIVFRVESSNDGGWVLLFRGEDAIQSVQLAATVTDGSGRKWYPNTGRMNVNGQTLKFNKDYHQFLGECRRAFVEIGSRYELVRDVPHWEQVMNFDQVVYSRIREAIAGRPLGAGLALQSLLVDFPSLAERMIQQREDQG
jgi:hypothetical protein